jgi:hypothetical protein
MNVGHMVVSLPCVYLLLLLLLQLLLPLLQDHLSTDDCNSERVQSNPCKMRKPPKESLTFLDNADIGQKSCYYYY